MALPNDSIAITPGSGATLAAHTIGGKVYQVVIPAGPNGHLSDSAETWVAWANNVSFDNAANVSHFSILNGNTDGKIVQIHKLFVVPLNLTAITGIMIRFDVMRITAHSGGTGITPEKLDSANGSLATGIDLQTKATSVTEGNRLFGFAMTNDEVGATGAVIAGSVAFQALNLFFESPRIQEFTLRQGEGIHVKQVTATSVGGMNGYICVFTVK